MSTATRKPKEEARAEQIARRYAEGVATHLGWHIERAESKLEGLRKLIAEEAGNAAAGAHVSSSTDDLFLRYRVAREVAQGLAAARSYLADGHAAPGKEAPAAEARIAQTAEWYQQGVSTAVERLGRTEAASTYDAPRLAAISKTLEALREAHRFTGHDLAVEIAGAEGWRSVRAAEEALARKVEQQARARSALRKVELEAEVAQAREAAEALSSRWAEAKAAAEAEIGAVVGGGVIAP